MPLTATVHSVPGTLRQEVEIAGRHLLVTDEPVRLGGDDSAPAPHELLPAALAACISTTLVMYARTKGWELGEVTVDVVFDNTAAPRQFDVDVRVGGPLDAEQLARLERVAASCPVRRTLEVGSTFVERISAAEPTVEAKLSRP